jgi:outer membrane receptor for ferric coprogen and ferric-rhodotorulic acid
LAEAWDECGSWNSYKPTVDIYGPLSKNIALE